MHLNIFYDIMKDEVQKKLQRFFWIFWSHCLVAHLSENYWAILIKGARDFDCEKFKFN